MSKEPGKLIHFRPTEPLQERFVRMTQAQITEGQGAIRHLENAGLFMGERDFANAAMQAYLAAMISPNPYIQDHAIGIWEEAVRTAPYKTIEPHLNDILRNQPQGTVFAITAAELKTLNWTWAHDPGRTM